MLPGNLMMVLFHETGDPRYATAARTIRTRLDTYPRTADGGLWHATTRPHQLWLDGTYMSLPFLVSTARLQRSKVCQRRGRETASPVCATFERSAYRPALPRLRRSRTHRNGRTPTRTTLFFWARSIGWFGMALVDVLEACRNHPDRPKLIALVRQLATAYEKYQDPATGLWFNVVDQPQLAGNWLETSELIHVCVHDGEGHAARLYRTQLPARRLQRISRRSRATDSATPDGDLHIANICDGTNVSDLPILPRPRAQTRRPARSRRLPIMNEVMRMTTPSDKHAAATAIRSMSRALISTGRLRPRSALRVRKPRRQPSQRDGNHLTSPLQYQVFQRRTRHGGDIVVAWQRPRSRRRRRARSGSLNRWPLAGTMAAIVARSSARSFQGHCKQPQAVSIKSKCASWRDTRQLMLQTVAACWSGRSLRRSPVSPTPPTMAKFRSRQPREWSPAFDGIAWVPRRRSSTRNAGRQQERQLHPSIR